MVQILVAEASSKQTGDQLFGDDVALAFAYGEGTLFAGTRRDVNGLNPPSTLHQLEANEHQRGFVRPIR